MTTKSREQSPNSSSAPFKTVGTLILVNDYVIKCQSSIPYTLPFCAMFPIGMVIAITRNRTHNAVSIVGQALRTRSISSKSGKKYRQPGMRVKY